MQTHLLYLLSLLTLLTLTACGDDDDTTMVLQPTTFELKIENVSQPNTIATDRAMGTVPLSPPAVAVFTGDDPMFTPGQRANLGTARIAEDGFPDEMLAILSGASNVTQQGAAPSPGGPDNGPALFAGESVTITLMAQPGDKLQFETMFVQSNDWFYAFTGGGIDLFTGDTPLSGEVTGRVDVYDAGTEQDTAPGTGPDQKPVQDPMATNVGPDEDVNIQLARQRHPSFTVPANNAVIRVTLTPQ